MATQTLFTLPILSSPTSDKGTGTVICTTTEPLVYVLTFTAPPDNRLVTSLCQSLLLALDIIEFSYPPGVVVTTSGIGKFYSNGLDLDHAANTEGYWTDSLFKLYGRLATYPMPTVALMNGHAFAGGLMLAMYQDYRVFNPSRGFLCLNELDFGVPLQPAMSSIFRQKVPASVYRSLVIEAKRFNAKEALEGAIVDGLGGMEEVLALIKERKLTEKGKSGIYGAMKTEMYRETLGYIAAYESERKRYATIVEADEKRKDIGSSRVREWEKNTKAKL